MSDDRRLFVDADGYVWWDNGDGTHSMARTNPGNNPTPEPFTYYAPVTAPVGRPGDDEQIVAALADRLAMFDSDRARVIAEYVLPVVRKAQAEALRAAAEGAGVIDPYPLLARADEIAADRSEDTA